MTELTKAYLRNLCKNQPGCYITPHVNDRLYIHFKGIAKLQNLEEYTGLQMLYAESNAISKLENLENQREMKSLYLQQNCIQKIEGLDQMTELRYLNLSENFITKVENLGACKKLQTLNLPKNNIATLDDLRHLVECESIEMLDLSNNRIQDEEVLEEVFFKMMQLKYLKLDGNPFIRKVKFYRKKLILALPLLKYLDTMPVTPEERRAAEAWERGGFPEEKLEKEKIRQEEKDKHMRSVKALDKMLEDHREEMRLKREQEALEKRQREEEELRQRELEEAQQQERELEELRKKEEEAAREVQEQNDTTAAPTENAEEESGFHIQSDHADTQSDTIGGIPAQDMTNKTDNTASAIEDDDTRPKEFYNTDPNAKQLFMTEPTIADDDSIVAPETPEQHTHNEVQNSECVA